MGSGSSLRRRWRRAEHANVNGTYYYFGYDALGSQVAVFNNSGNLIGSQLYGPYGDQRYSNGTLPTTIGFTGQQADSVTGLDYYNARYYDPAVGQFLSGDIVQGNAVGADPYSYVGGNPESRIDPTGQRYTCGPDGGCGGSGGGGYTPPCGTPPAMPCPGTSPTPTPTPTGGINHCDPGTHSDGNGGCAADPKPSKKPQATCTFLDCIQNWGLFSGGLLIILGGLSVLGLAIAGYINAAGGFLGFLETMAKGFVEKAVNALLGMIHAGMLMIRGSLFKYANQKILDIVLDVVGILADFATIILSGASALKQIADGRAKSFFSAISILFRGFLKGQLSSIGRTKALGAALGKMGGGFAGLAWDFTNLVIDIQRP